MLNTYRVSIKYTVSYDPNSEVHGISIFYPEGHTDLVVDGYIWDEYLGNTQEEAIEKAKNVLLWKVSGGRYEHGTIKIHSINARPVRR